MNTQLANGQSQEISGEVVRPNQAMQVTESSRTLAEVQAALTVAAGRPRDEVHAIQRITNACQRPRLAEGAAYEYSRGGQSITGASIRLMECIASYWGNLQFGFRELSQSGGESTVEAYAWDMETNTKRSVTFVVPHRMKSGKGIKVLTDPRDIYEYVANQSQRRVRSCLENVIPRDIVEDALDECEKTMHANIKVTPESIREMRDAFRKDFGVVGKQIEKRIGRNLESMTPAQMMQMKRIWKSLKDGMSDVDTWFKPVEDEEPQSNQKNQSTTEKVKARGKKSQKKSEPEEDQGGNEPTPAEARAIHYQELLESGGDPSQQANIMAQVDADDLLDDAEKKRLAEMAT